MAVEMSDYAYAIRMMRAIQRRIIKEIDRVRPDYEYVLVDSVNALGNTLRVHYKADPDNSFNVSTGSNLPVYPGQKVRIGGREKDKHVIDIASGPVAQCPPGAIVWRASSTIPPGWLKADGSAFDPVMYATLYSEIGTNFGGTSAAPLLPNFNATFSGLTALIKY